MNLDFNFLRTVCSLSGINCITEIGDKTKGGYTVNHPIRFSDEVATTGLVQQLQHYGKPTYFALGAFANTDSSGRLPRKQDNVVALRSFWLDIDAGANKYHRHPDTAYPTRDDALHALYAELENGRLPEPTYVVSSGEGLHVYWCADSDMAPAVWKPLAKQLQRYCQMVGFKVDPARTSDEASVLRPVGTLHHSSGNVVSIIRAGAVYPQGTLLQAMSSLPVPHSLPAHNALPVGIPGLGTVPGLAAHSGSSMEGMAAYPAAAFGKIIELQKHERTGCAQLLYAYEEQATLEEPLWYAALTVAQHCIVDRDEWVHRLSVLHPAYERGATEAKAAQATGPMNCADFELRNPKGCEGCPHRGRITNPIVLGYQPENRPTVVNVPAAPGSTETVELLVPTMPYGFYRGMQGGVYTTVPKTDELGKVIKGETEEFCICPQDLYLFERVRESAQRQLFLGRYHSPHDGVIEFQMSSDDIYSLNDRFRATVVGAGIPIHGEQRWKLLMSFFNQSRTTLVSSRAAVNAVQQMGWQPDNKEFVLGDTVITRTGTRHAPLGEREVAKKFAKAFKPTATGDAADTELVVWRNLLHEMYGHPHAVANQFVLCSALGAPFSAKYALESHAGGIISLVSSQSGRGKTFTCQAALRMFGQPAEMTFGSKSGVTVNALMTNLGYLNSIPLLRDEITELNSEEVVDLVYDSTRLGDKERAQGSDNDIRANRAKWRTFFYTTANSSMYDIMASGRDVVDGPSRRVTEIMIPPLDYLADQTVARRLAKSLHGICATPGRKLVEWMVRNEDEANDLWDTLMNGFVVSTRATNEERYWVNHLVSGIVGAVIGDRLGILPFEPKAIMNFAIEQLAKMRRRLGYRVVEHTDYLAQFLVDNADHILIQSGIPTDDRTVTVLELPRKAAYIRIEPQAGWLYINHTLIKSWCGSRKIVLADFTLELAKLDGDPNAHRNMLANTNLAPTMTPQRVWRVPLPGNVPLPSTTGDNT